jgi:oligosaccharide repeat unit polymerase
MFLVLIWLTIATCLACVIFAYKSTRDIFHPAVIALPMFAFLYGWMPLRLLQDDTLFGYFDPEQLCFVQLLNLAGILAFVWGCVLFRPSAQLPVKQMTCLSEIRERRLLMSSVLIGLLGLIAWTVTIHNVGGLTEAFSRPYSGGWDDSGYLRDGSLLLFPAESLAISVLVMGRRRRTALVLAVGFMLPMAFQAIFTSRRGPAFMICAIVSLSWFFYRRTRPSVLIVVGAAILCGYGILLLVVNRQQMYLGSSFNLNTSVGTYVNRNDSSNEYIYGSGSILNSYYAKSYYWGHRYLAQVVIRPIPSALWPTKYEDFGVADLLKNAGNATTFSNTLGWKVPPGAAPGIIADLWVEFSFGMLLCLWLIGRFAAWIWFRAVTAGGLWTAQYCILGTLSIYFVMQTMEAVIFRFSLLSVPLWLAWSSKRQTRSIVNRENEVELSVP